MKTSVNYIFIVTFNMLMTFYVGASEVSEKLTPVCDCQNIGELSEQITKILEFLTGPSAENSKLKILAVLTKNANGVSCLGLESIEEEVDLNSKFEITIGGQTLPTKLIEFLDLNFPGERKIYFRGDITGHGQGLYVLETDSSGKNMIFKIQDHKKRNVGWKKTTTEIEKDGETQGVDVELKDEEGRTIKFHGREDNVIIGYKTKTELDKFPIILTKGTDLAIKEDGESGGDITMTSEYEAESGPLKASLKLINGEDESKTNIRMELGATENIKLISELGLIDFEEDELDLAAELKVGDGKVIASVSEDAGGNVTKNLRCEKPLKLGDEVLQLKCGIEAKNDEDNPLVTAEIGWKKEVVERVTLTTDISAGARDGEVVVAGGKVGINRKVGERGNYGAYVEIKRAKSQETEAILGIQVKKEIGELGRATMVRVYDLYSIEEEFRGGQKQTIAYYETWKYICELDKKKLKVEKPKKRLFGGVDKNSLYQLALPVGKKPLQGFQEPTGVNLNTFCK